MIEMDALARERSEKTGETFSDWLQAIEWAAEQESVLQLTDGEFTTLIQHSSSVVYYRQVVEWFEAHRSEGSREQTGFDLLVEFIDESNHSFMDWVKALNTFHQWVEDNKTSVTLKRALGYIQCSSQELKSARGDLSKTVKSYLESHGLE